MFHVQSDSDRLKHAQKNVRSANLASVCSWDAFFACSFEPSRPDRLADNPGVGGRAALVGA